MKIPLLSSALVFPRYFTFTYGSITSYPLRNKWDNLAFSRGVARSPKLFVFILTKFVRQALFPQISGLSNPPMKPEADVIIDIYTGKY